MKNPDEAIERVLASMRDAEGPAGLEARILRTIELRNSEQTAGGWWRLWMGWRLAGGAVTAGVVALVVFSITSRNAGHVVRERWDVGIAEAPSGLASAEKAVPAVPRRVEPHASMGGQVTAEFVPASRANVAPREVEEETDYDSMAISEMLAPSKPAPPLPLTQQETLLAQVVRKGDPEQVADLKPEVRAKQVEIARAEFQDFFEPPKPKEQLAKPKT